MTVNIKMRRIVVLSVMAFFISCSNGYSKNLITIPGVKIGIDGTVVVLGAEISPDGSVKAPGGNIDSDGSVIVPGISVNIGDDVEIGPQDNVSNDITDQDYMVNDDSQRLTLNCNGGSVVVSGDNNTITCNGDCQNVSVNGDENRILFMGKCRELSLNGEGNRLRLQFIGSINAFGDNNRVIWGSGLDGRKPEIRSIGDNNVIEEKKE